MGKKKKFKKLVRKAIKEMNVLLSSQDDEVYEGSCNCEGQQQVCDVCQDTNSWDSPDEELDEFHYFEIMDRIHVIQCSIEDHVGDHPAMTKSMTKMINQAQDCLTNVYQTAGKIFFEIEDR